MTTKIMKMTVATIALVMLATTAGVTTANARNGHGGGGESDGNGGGDYKSKSILSTNLPDLPKPPNWNPKPRELVDNCHRKTIRTSNYIYRYVTVCEDYVRN